MRILLTSNYYPEHPGGIESVAATLAAGYRGLGHEVRWAAADVPGARRTPGAGDRPLPASNFTERHLGFPYPVPSWRSLRSLREDVEWADVLHLHDSLYAVSQACFRHARGAGRPVLVTQHVPPIRYANPGLRALQGAAYAALGHPLLEGADQVAFVSQAVAAAYSWLRFRRPPVVVENAVDTRLFAPASPAERTAARRAAGLDPERPTLIFVGRFVRKKGIDRLREVARRLRDVQVVMVGRTDDIDPRTWREPNLKVLPPMPQPRLRQYYVAADLLFLLSSGEGFPVSIQEAMACGTPALASAAVARAVPGLDGLLFAYDGGDLTQVTLSALERAPARREAVAAAARERWAPRSMLAAYADLIGSIRP